MIVGGVVAIFFGVNAEGKSLEDIATPLSVIGKPPAAIFRSGADRDGIDRSGAAPMPDPRWPSTTIPRRRPDDGPVA